jgi:hypothetical protein
LRVEAIPIFVLSESMMKSMNVLTFGLLREGRSGNHFNIDVIGAQRERLTNDRYSTNRGFDQEGVTL